MHGVLQSTLIKLFPLNISVPKPRQKSPPSPSFSILLLRQRRALHSIIPSHPSTDIASLHRDRRAGTVHCGFLQNSPRLAVVQLSTFQDPVVSHPPVCGWPLGKAVTQKWALLSQDCSLDGRQHLWPPQKFPRGFLFGPSNMHGMDQDNQKIPSLPRACQNLGRTQQE